MKTYRISEALLKRWAAHSRGEIKEEIENVLAHATEPPAPRFRGQSHRDSCMCFSCMRAVGER